MPPRSPGANDVMKTSGSAAAAGRNETIRANATKARNRRTVVIGKLLECGRSSVRSAPVVCVPVTLLRGNLEPDTVLQLLAVVRPALSGGYWRMHDDAFRHLKNDLSPPTGD